MIYSETCRIKRTHTLNARVALRTVTSATHPPRGLSFAESRGKRGSGEEGERKAVSFLLWTCTLHFSFMRGALWKADVVFALVAGIVCRSPLFTAPSPPLGGGSRFRKPTWGEFLLSRTIRRNNWVKPQQLNRSRHTSLRVNMITYNGKY